MQPPDPTALGVCQDDPVEVETISYCCLRCRGMPFRCKRREEIEFHIYCLHGAYSFPVSEMYREVISYSTPFAETEDIYVTTAN